VRAGLVRVVGQLHPSPALRNVPPDLHLRLGSRREYTPPASAARRATVPVSGHAPFPERWVCQNRRRYCFALVLRKIHCGAFLLGVVSLGGSCSLRGVVGARGGVVTKNRRGAMGSLRQSAHPLGPSRASPNQVPMESRGRAGCEDRGHALAFRSDVVLGNDPPHNDQDVVAAHIGQELDDSAEPAVRCAPERRESPTASASSCTTA